MSIPQGTGRGRGGYAPRRGRGGWSRPFVKRQEPVKPDISQNPLGELLVLFRPSDLEPSQNTLPTSSRIGDCQYVTSYNWLAGKDSTVLVPGQPPQWTPPQVVQKLPEDNGTYFRDPNAARYPDYPIAPAVKAIVDTKNDAIADAEVFACGSTLGNLLRFARGIDKAFRFSVEVIGDTVFFIRKENDPKEVIEGVRGFGHTFPEAYTTWPKDVKGSETHQRLVRYDLGGLHCLVRYECDGFFDNEPGPPISQPVAGEPASEDSLAQALLGTIISTPQTTTTQPLTIKSAGRVVAQSSIFDLKTRSGRHGKEINMDDITPQLWLKQIPNFIVAYHDGHGLFQDIQIQDVRPRVAKWEQDNAQAIQRFVVLLRKIVELAKSDGKGLLELYCPNNQVLEVRRQHGAGVHALPTSLHEQWVVACGAGGLALDGDDTGYGASPGDYGASSESSEDSDDGEKDFTACSAEDCGYCGRCTY